MIDTCVKKKQYCRHYSSVGVSAILQDLSIFLFQMERVTHAIALCFEIALVILIGYNLNRHILYDFKSICLKSYTLGRIVGHKAHFAHTEVAQHLRSASVVALVRLKSEMGVGVDCVVAFLLQLVSLYLVHESYAASFLLHIHEHSLAFLLYHLHGFMELLSAVATLRAEHVACGAR